ncbi:MAG: BACON domain-containing protein [Bacteroidales bacterium]|nr:BACON domain-containing protein [Bacteroidales bacterium]
MNTFRSLSVLMAGLLMIAVACEPEPQVNVTPVFPELVQDNNVAPGSTMTLTFDANADWEVSVSSENLQWFWIKDGSFKVDKVSGKVAAGDKSPVTVQIGVSETEEFDTNRSCDVTLTMGGESRIIAKYMRPAKARAMAVYVAKVEDGAFVKEGDSYVYETVEASSSELIWSDEDKDFRLPVRVESNCSWTMDLPEWVDANVPESTVGIVEFVLTGASLDDASGKITFKDGGEALKELSVSIPSCREMSVYAVQLDENGEFMFADSGSYLYSEESVTSARLVWPGADFRLPVMVVSKCDWTLEAPEWVTASFEGKTAGTIEFNLQGVPSKYPLDETTGNIRFMFAGEAVYELEITIPASKNLSSYSFDMSLTSLDYSYTGMVKTSTGYSASAATCRLFGHSDVDMFAVEMIDGKPSGAAPDWMGIEIEAYDSSKDAEVLQSRSVSITVTENTTEEERHAYVFFNRGYDWPATDELFTSAGEVKEEYKQYAVPVVQYGRNMPYITMASKPEDMAALGASFESLTGSKMKLLQKYFGTTEHVYSLTYNNIYASDNADMFFAVPYASYKIYDSSRKEMTGDSSFWISFQEFSASFTYGCIEMYSSEDMSVPETSTSGFVVFYDAAENPLAIVEVIFDPKKIIGEDVEIKFVGESAQYAEMVGATLEEVTEGTLYDQYKEYGAPIYHLTYRMMGMPMRISIPATAVMYTPNPYVKRNIFRVNNLNYDETVGRFDLLEGGVDIYMVLEEGSTSEYERGNILFYNSENMVVLALVCTLDLRIDE